MNYELITTGATYAPWLDNIDFGIAFEDIGDHTLVHKNRCYELWTTVQQLSHIEGNCLEVGVWRGGTGAIIARASALSGNHDLVYLCDTFNGVVKAGANDPRYKGGEHRAEIETVRALITKMDLRNTMILPGVFPDETGLYLDKQVFRFVHIDVDVYASAKDIMEWAWPRLSRGGVVMFDDYGFKQCGGVTTFVNEWAHRHDALMIYNLNGHGIVIKHG